MRGRTHTWIRQHVLGLVAIFIALTGTALAAQQSGSSDGRKASASVVTDAKFRKLKQRVVALEGRTSPTIPAIPTTLPPSGPAGGDLTGSYPNPEIGLGKVGAAEIADFSVGVSEFAFNIPWARATRTATQSIPSATDTVLAFDSERFDSGSLHDNVTNNSRMTAPASGSIGIFAVTASVHFAANATGTRTVTLRRSGTTAIASETQAALSGVPTTINVSTLASLSGNGSSYLEVVVSQNSGSPLDVVKSDEVSPEFTMIYLPSND